MGRIDLLRIGARTSRDRLYKSLHFVANARRSDEAVRRVADTYAVEAISNHSPVQSWIVDARFAARRVVPAYDDRSRAADERDELSLLVERRDGEAEPADCLLPSLPKHWTKKQLIRIVMQRWRTEGIYGDLKGELGFDHDEARSFQGWHDLVSVVLWCYAFVVAERARRFPPRPEMTWKATRSALRPERQGAARDMRWGEPR
jgi:SRSO17 transposase